MVIVDAFVKTSWSVPDDQVFFDLRFLVGVVVFSITGRSFFSIIHGSRDLNSPDSVVWFFSDTCQWEYASSLNCISELSKKAYERVMREDFIEPLVPEGPVSFKDKKETVVSQEE